MSDGNTTFNTTDVAQNNANAFNPGFANPFLVTSYSQPSLAGYAKDAAITEISSIISTIDGNFANVLSLSTYTHLQNYHQ